MAGSTISSRVTISVTLGSAAYLSPLTITQAGYVEPFADFTPPYNLGLYGATALVGTIAGGSILNQGTLTGSGGADSHDDPSGNIAGGIGVDLVDGSLVNSGAIAGGFGGYDYTTAAGGDGGAGVTAVDSSLTNSAAILGGAGGTDLFGFEEGAIGAGGSGGAGVELTASDLTNNDVIRAGSGGAGSNPLGSAGPGGIGVDATGSPSTLNNYGLISGGSAVANQNGPAGSGGAGVYLAAGSTLTNNDSGSIVGGDGGSTYIDTLGGSGAAGVEATLASITNVGAITGGTGGGAGGPEEPGLGGSGGTGVDLAGGGFVNFNAVMGGEGGEGGRGAGGAGGTGVVLTAGATLTNAGGQIFGGDGNLFQGPNPFAAAGGYGVRATNSSLTNQFMIYGGSGGNGGTGADLVSSMLTNDAFIDGGNASRALYNGIGVDATTSTVTNNGAITGGYYGVILSSGGLVTNAAAATITGHTGVAINGGGTLVNAGTIASEPGPFDAFPIAAVTFSGAGLLVDDPGAVFAGSVVAQASTTLELADGAGTIAGIGTSFTGFGTIEVDPAATWVVTGSVSGNGTISLGAGSDLTFGGGVTSTSPVHFTATTGSLGLADPANFAATVFGLQPGNAIDFTSITSTGSITAGVNGSNDLTLTSNGVLLTEIKLDPTQSFIADAFHAAPDGRTGTVVTDTPLCFLAGTLIANPVR